MKVWEKNFLYTLSLFTIVFFTCIFIITSTSFSSAVQSERESALREQHLITESISADIAAIEERENASSKAVPSLVASYAAYYQKKNIYLSISAGDSALYSNIPVNNAGFDFYDNESVCEILNVDGNRYVSVASLLQGLKQPYRFVYLKNINSMYDSQRRYTFILLAMGVGVSVAFAFGLYFTLKKIYRPIDNLAHELRTPLTAIRGYAEYLLNAAASEEDRFSATQYIIDESRRLADISEKLLIMANLREGAINYEKVDIKSLFENAGMTFNNVEYSTETQHVRGDRALLQSMINNLVSNAVKASPKGRPVVLKSYDNIIEIKDDGSGMSKKALSQAERPGQKVKTVYKDKKGNGLGIPLCHQIARLHNANIKFISEEGEGTTVRITFTNL